MTMRKVSLVRFPAVGTRELFGRTIGVLRAQDGYGMTLHIESGLLLIRDAKDGGEAAVHTSRVDACYLEPEDEAAVSAMTRAGLQQQNSTTRK